MFMPEINSFFLYGRAPLGGVCLHFFSCAGQHISGCQSDVSYRICVPKFAKNIKHGLISMTE